MMYFSAHLKDKGCGSALIDMNYQGDFIQSNLVAFITPQVSAHSTHMVSLWGSLPSALQKICLCEE